MCVVFIKLAKKKKKKKMLGGQGGVCRSIKEMDF